MDRSWTAEELSARLAYLARQAAEEGGCPVSQLQAVGAGLPGLVDNRAGVVVKTTNMPFRNTPLRALFQRELELPSIWATTLTARPLGSSGPVRPGAVTLRWWSPWGPGSAAAWFGAVSCTLASAVLVWRQDIL